jgi:hypothetical protein
VATTGAKSVTATPPVAKPHPTTSLLEGISDLVDNYPSRHVLSCPVGSSHPSHPNHKERIARGPSLRP